MPDAAGRAGACGPASGRLGRTVSRVSEYAGSVWLVAVPAGAVCTAVAPFGYDETTGTAPLGVQPWYWTATVCALPGSLLTRSTARSPFGRRDAWTVTN